MTMCTTAFFKTCTFYKSIDLTPLTKGILGSLVLSSVAFIVPLQAYRHWFTYTFSTIFEKHQVSSCLLLMRILTLQLTKDALCTFCISSLKCNSLYRVV